MELEQLLQKLHQAFSSVALLHERIAPHHCEECDGIGTFLQGRDRDSLSRGDLDVFGNARMHLMTLEVIHYYFPRMIKKALALDGTELLRDVLYYLDFYSARSGSQVILCKSSQVLPFTEEQRQAILSFLNFVKDNRYSDVVGYMCEEELERTIQVWT